MIEPNKNLSAVVPRMLCSGKGKTHICAINVSTRNVVLRKGECVGKAHEVTLAAPVNEGLQTIDKVRRMQGPLSKETDVGGDDIPHHIQDLLERAKTNISDDEYASLRTLLVEYEDVFAENDFDLGDFNDIEHSIDTGTAKPVRQRMRRTQMCFVDEEKANLEKMLQAKVIQPSVSEWAEAPVLIRKRDGQVRWCVDYRCLNKVTSKDVFPLPLVEECMDTLSGNCWYSKLDANSAYWQVKIKKSDRKKTAFATKYGLYEFVRMGFGLCNAPATYCRVMNLVLRGLNWNILLAFLDDILVMGNGFADHLRNLEQVFQRFRQYGLKLKPRKCELYQVRVEFLGRVVGKQGLQMGVEHIKVVQNWPTPKNTRQVEQFLGLVNYHSVECGNCICICGTQLFTEMLHICVFLL